MHDEELMHRESPQAQDMVGGGAAQAQGAAAEAGDSAQGAAAEAGGKAQGAIAGAGEQAKGTAAQAGAVERRGDDYRRWKAKARVSGRYTPADAGQQIYGFYTPADTISTYQCVSAARAASSGVR